VEIKRKREDNIKMGHKEISCNGETKLILLTIVSAKGSMTELLLAYEEGLCSRKFLFSVSADKPIVIYRNKRTFEYIRKVTAQIPKLQCRLN
jgi:hypothetical protein